MTKTLRIALQMNLTTCAQDLTQPIHLYIANDCGLAKRTEAVEVRMTLGIYGAANVTMNILCNDTNHLTSKLHTLTFGHISMGRAHDSWSQTSDCNI
jgi:hypothetical protein